METESVKATFHDVHHHQYSSGSAHENEEGDKASSYTSTRHKGYKYLIEENFSQLRVSKRQSPQSQVRGSVGNCSQNKFDGLNHLVNEKVCKFVVISSLLSVEEDSFSNSKVSIIFFRSSVLST